MNYECIKKAEYEQSFTKKWEEQNILKDGKK